MRRFLRFFPTLCLAAWLASTPACAATEPLPAGALAALRGSGLPLKSFGVHMRPVDGAAPRLGLNDEQPYLLASTTKIVTSLAALQLLGPAYQWRTQAYASAAVGNGRTAGDLVLIGGSAGGLTPAELRRWFKRMQSEGLTQVGGRIVLDRFALLHEQHPAQAATTAAELAPGGPAEPASYNRGALVVAVQPGTGPLAVVSLQPRPAGVVIDNDVLMGGGNCGARVRWVPPARAGGGADAGPAQLQVSGRWDQSCGRQEVAFVKLPEWAAAAAPATAPTPGGGGRAAVVSVSTPALVAALWGEAGGRLRGGAVELQPRRTLAPVDAARAAPPWSSQITTSLAGMVREINKTSNNVAAKNLLLSLAPPTSTPAPATAVDAGLRSAQGRVQTWLRGQGFADDDIRIDQGSGQSRIERGKPRAMVDLLANAWRSRGSREFVESLPIAGVDGTLVNRMRKGPAAGRAFLKTGTLSDTRALAGYVVAASGKVYAVALMVNHADAARATPALDALIEWLARNG